MLKIDAKTEGVIGHKITGISYEIGCSLDIKLDSGDSIKASIKKTNKEENELLCLSIQKPEEELIYEDTLCFCEDARVENGIKLVFFLAEMPFICRIKQFQREFNIKFASGLLSDNRVDYTENDGIKLDVTPLDLKTGKPFQENRLTFSIKRRIISGISRYFFYINDKCRGEF